MVGKYDCQFLYYSFVQTEWIFIKTWGWHKFFSGNHQNTSFLLSILRHIASLLFFILLLLIINRPSLVLLLDHEHDGEDREAAEGEDVAEPFDSNVRDCEDAQEDHTDDVVPGDNHNDSRISRMSSFDQSATFQFWNFPFLMVSDSVWEKFGIGKSWIWYKKYLKFGPGKFGVVKRLGIIHILDLVTHWFWF